MASELQEEVGRLRKAGKNDSQIRLELLQKGFMDEEVRDALGAPKMVHTAEKRHNRLYSSKEFLDRIGYGFATPQFINILFWMSGASYFLIGLINGVKTILQLIISSVVQEYSQKHTIGKRKMANAGLLFGFSFFLMAYATLANVPWLFIIGFLVSAIGVVTHGDLYLKLLRETIKHERRSAFLRKIAQHGTVVSAAALILSGFLIDKVPGQTTMFTLFGIDFRFKIYGFLLSFMITAFAFILSSYVVSKLPDFREQNRYKFGLFIKEHLHTVGSQFGIFLKNRYVLLLLLATVLSGFLQVMGASYYGVYMFQAFRHYYLGGFANIALLYAVALIASLVGPVFMKRVQRSTGLAPHLVFGTLLTAILPLVLWRNPHYYAVMAGLVLAVIGSAIVGVAQGMIAQKIMDHATRRMFFITQSFMVAIPYIVLMPIGAWFAQTYGLELLFFGVGIGLAAIVAPLYFILVAITSRVHL